MKKSILILTIMLFVASTVFAVSFGTTDDGVKRAPTPYGPQVYNPGNNSRVTHTIGAGALTSTSTSDTPFGTYYEDGQNQYLFTAAELTAAGIPAGNITGIGWNVVSASSANMLGFNIEMKHTAATAVSTFETGFTNVYTGTPIAIAGWNDFVFSTVFLWDGISNVLVKVCFDNAGYTSNSSVLKDTTPLAMNAYAYNDGTAGCTDPYEGNLLDRPQTRFTTPDLVPVLGSSPVCPFNFGQVAAPVTQTITLTNIGAGVLDIAAGAITISGDTEFTLTNIIGLPGSLPSDVITFDVTYTPVTNGSFTADVSVTWNAADDITTFTFLGSRCVVEQPIGSTLENEPCGTDVNGGCNMAVGTESWTPIAIGETIFANAWSDGSTRDTDWYELTLTEPMTVTWAFVSDMTLISGYITGAAMVPGAPDCALVESISPNAIVEPCVDGSVVMDLVPGTHWFFAGDSDYAGAPCPGGNYTVTATGVPWCAPPTDMIETSLTQTSAVLEWTPVGIETEWAIEWGLQGFTPGADPAQGVIVTGLTTSSYPLTGLQDSTSYDWYVEATCSAFVSSVQAGPKTFSTLEYCPVPTGLAISNLALTSVTLDWNAMPNAISYDWEIVPAGNAQGVGVIDSGLGVVTNTASSILLTSNTAYDYRVLSTCNDPVRSVSSLWSAPFSFQTPCPTYVAPNTEGFEGGVFPDCWRQETADNFDWTVNSGSTTSSGTGPSAAYEGIYYIYTETSGPANGSVATFYSPVFDLSALADPQLAFAYHMFGAGMDPDGSITVGISVAGGAYTNIFTEIGDHGDVWNLFTHNLSGYVGLVQFSFTGTVSSSGTNYQNDFALDDIKVIETPTCPEPTALTVANITANGADLGWTENGIATLWDIELVLGGVAPTGVPTHNVNVNPYPMTGLTPTTSYDFYVRADCGIDQSPWVGPYNFMTTQVPGTCGTWTIDLTDSYGDGWNGCAADLYVDGVLIHAGMTIVSGAGPVTYTFETNLDGFVSVDYTAASYPTETEYLIYDHNSVLVASSGAGGAIPSDLGGPFPNPTSGYTTCATLPVFDCSPASFDFGSALVGNSSLPQTFTISNLGAGTLTFTGASITGTDAAEFALTDLNTYPVEVGASIVVDVTFVSLTAGAKTAFLTIVDTETRVAHDIPLTGFGIGNNDCATAEVVGEVVDLLFDTSGATASGLGTCMTSPDLWYVYTATADGSIYVDLCGSIFDTKLAVYDGNCLALNELGCNDDACYTRALQSQLDDIPVFTGVDYYIQVGGYSTATGAGDLTITYVPLPDAPANVSVDVLQGTNEVIVSWDYVAGLVYSIYSDTDPYGTFATLVTSGVATGSYSITPIPGVNTWYVVKANYAPARVYTNSKDQSKKVGKQK